MTKRSPKRDAITELFSRFAGQANTLAIPRPYIDLCGGDHLTALLLSQILYWSDRTDNKDGWFSKSYEEWYEELAMTQYQVTRAIQGDKRPQKGNRKSPTLRDLGVETKLMPSKHHEGAPTLHYRIDFAKLQVAVVDFVDNAVIDNVYNGESTLSITGYKQSQQSYTETTTETTTENVSPSGDNTEISHSKPQEHKHNPVFEAVSKHVYDIPYTEIKDKPTRARIGKVAKSARANFETAYPTPFHEGWTPELEAKCARAVEVFTQNWQRENPKANIPRDAGKFGTHFLTFLKGYKPHGQRATITPLEIDPPPSAESMAELAAAQKAIRPAWEKEKVS